MKRIIVAAFAAFSLLAVSAGVAGASGGPSFVPQTNPCVRDLYSSLAALGSHPRRTDVDAVITDYIDCRGGTTSFGSPFQFDFPINNPFSFRNAGFFRGEFFNDFGPELGGRCDLSFSFTGTGSSSTAGIWEDNAFGVPVCTPLS